MANGVIVYPTDTMYAIGCSMHSRQGLERIARIKNQDPAKALLSFVCADLKHLSRYARQIDTPTYRVLRQHLPGPFTFVLAASREVPRIMQSKKSTVGLRVPDHAIVHALVDFLGHPLLSATVPHTNLEDAVDPELIYEDLGNLVDLVIDGGAGGTEPSTVVDLTAQPPLVIRQGKGDWPETS